MLSSQSDETGVVALECAQARLINILGYLPGEFALGKHEQVAVVTWRVGKIAGEPDDVRRRIT